MADKKFIDEALKAHNEYRKKHGQAPLKLNKVTMFFIRACNRSPVIQTFFGFRLSKLLI